MAFYPHDALPQADPVVAKTVKDYMVRTRNEACKIYGNHTNTVTGGATAFPTAMGLIQGVLDSMCENSTTPLPPRPSQQFNGGQCPVIYLVTVKYQAKKFDGTPDIEQTTSAYVWGEIKGFRLERLTNGNIQFGCDCHNVAVVPRSPGIVFVGFTTALFGFASASVVSIVRDDGLPDNCGNPDPQFPPVLTLPPDPSARIIPIPQPSGRPINITLPVGFAYLDNNFEVKIDVGGVTANFDAGGVTINLGNKETGDGSPGSFDGQGNQFPDDYATRNQIEGVNTQLDVVNQNVSDLQGKYDSERLNQPEGVRNNPNKQDKFDRNENDPKEETAIPRLIAVRITLTQIPQNSRIQSGDGAPDVIYAGWFEFTSKGIPLPRTPIHFGFNHFPAPVGVDGYAYTLYDGVKGYATVYQAKVNA